jgi:hypothetical protein
VGDALADAAERRRAVEAAAPGCQQAFRLGDGLQALRSAVDPAEDPIEQGLRRLHGVIVATRGSHAIGELADAGRGNP